MNFRLKLPRGKHVLAALLLVVSLWAVAALFYDVRIAWLRMPLAGLYLALSAFLFWRLRTSARIMLAWLATIVLIMAWWLNLEPSNDGRWQADVARLPQVEVQGDDVTLRFVRDFDYRTETDYVQRWETATVDLKQLRGVDLFVTHWGAPLIAHMIVSFRFATREGKDKFVAMSIEARKTERQEYSAIRGFFRQYGLIYLVADERDVVRVRTNYRTGEIVRLYRTELKPEDARGLFRQYLDWIEYQRAHPQWYNALTDNCSSSVAWYLAKRHIGGLAWWDVRLWLNGLAEQMLYEHGDLAANGLSFAQLSKQAVINGVAKEADQDPDFSFRIRQGRAGF